MAIIVISSNFLVQFPVAAPSCRHRPRQILTWGAFTYPVAFLVTDLTNRRFGPGAARRVVVVGFVIAVLWSVFVATPRIALASGTAFLVGQLLDVFIFDRMRADPRWWRAPLLSSLLGSVLDTLIFFGARLRPGFRLSRHRASALPTARSALPRRSGASACETAFWLSLATGDFAVKLAVALLAAGALSGAADADRRRRAVGAAGVTTLLRQGELQQQRALPVVEIVVRDDA